MPQLNPITVVIPCHNEAGAIADLVAETFGALGPVCAEILVVDDGSTDGTAAALLRQFPDDPRLRLIRHGRCWGQSSAIRTGVRAATTAWIATLDGDGQNPPDQILTLIARLEQADAARVGLVQGQRRDRQDAGSRRLASVLANRIRNYCLHDTVADSGCGLKLFRRDAWLGLPFFNHIHRFTPAMMQREGWLVLVSPVTHRPRIAGASKYTNFRRAMVGIVDLAGAAWLIMRAGVPSTTLEGPGAANGES
ncbi:glycosyltransferase family 2 protein [Paracoccus laeviglucosivorans]|uniref:Dolichol-phosphate mannosyltransferase n=1 Tax=Paracoccus laeviglucosivorans TaxID=1197861 RepID=A0A521F2C5_9RHOB|nr:glycosyltransferase family 2 protein [Paracoccus laeviglucosivorans]SMO90335.1 dolichol-phosphate mannosyltransferase [Paracoccus laeviglucosivorans]